MLPPKSKTLTKFLALHAFVEEAERDERICEWRYKDVCVWPVVKYILVKNLIEAERNGYEAQSKYDNYKVFAERNPLLLPEASAAVTETPPPFFSEIPSATDGRSSILAFGRRSSLVQICGLELNQQLDPYRMSLADLGYKTITFWQGHTRDAVEEKLPKDEYSIDAFIMHINKKAAVPIFIRESIYTYVPKFQEFCAGIGFEPDSVCAFMDTMIGRLDFARPHIADLLERLRPMAVITSNYASIYGWATAHECRRLGLPFIDLQHGIQGRFSGSSHWSLAPQSDWTVVPTHQICWTEDDVLTFEAGHRNRRAVAVGPGSLLLPELLTSNAGSPVLAQAGGMLRAFRTRLEAALTELPRPLVLFAAQQDGDIRKAADLADQLSGTVLYRSHPTRPLDALRQVEPKRFADLHVELASQTPLALLLETVDLVVTGYSATILEAALLGKPSVAVGAFAKLLLIDYADQLSGRLCVVDNGDISGAVVATLSECAPLDRTEPRPARTRIAEALEALGLHRARSL